MAKILIGHHADNDGFVSFEIARRAFKITNPSAFVKGVWLTRTNADTKFISAIEADDTVAILDYSLSLEKMLDIEEKVDGRFTLIDHHRTCYEMLKEAGVEFSGVVSAPNEPIAACQLSWKYFFKDKPMPEAVQLLGNFDVWEFSKDPTTIAPEIALDTGVSVISSSMDWKERDELWDQLIFQDNKATLNRVKMIGTLVVKDNLKRVDFLYANAPIVTVDGIQMKLINIDNPIIMSYWSDCNRDKCSFPLLMFSQSSKGSIRFSVRTGNSDLDCGRFCEKYAGGGHEKSAGFNLSWEEFLMFAEENSFGAIPPPQS